MLILNEWIVNEVQTGEQALIFHEQNYGELSPDASEVELSDDFLQAMDLWGE